MSKKILGSIIIFTLLGISDTSLLYAIDEEYFIPYTDNYGYEYDPVSGTYIKKENPATQSTDTQQTTGTQQAAMAASGVEIQNQLAKPNAQPAVQKIEVVNSQVPILLAGLVAVFALVFVLARKFKQAK